MLIQKQKLGNTQGGKLPPILSNINLMLLWKAYVENTVKIHWIKILSILKYIVKLAIYEAIFFLHISEKERLENIRELEKKKEVLNLL